jgi:nicotinate phosphoribosyltransferase
MTTFQRIGPLFTDLYELTMAAGYVAHRIDARASFSLFVRDYPPERGFFIAAGLENALRELKNFRFTDGEREYLKETGLFDADFVDYLGRLRFTGDIVAVPEGTVFFADEPILEVTAPIVEAQLIETFLLNTVGFQTLIASKAARCYYAASGRPLIDFSLRRTQGQDAGLKVARSTYIAGFSATSNVLAGKCYGIPISGTMAHSFVSAFDSEREAFSAYFETFPESTVLLIDTYDTLEGAKNAAAVGVEMKKKGRSLVGVRLDSGDMVELSRKVRNILDDAGLSEVKIFASSGFDELQIARVIEQGAAIDAFGVGTKVGVSADAPYLDIVYKLVRFRDRDVKKLSPGKINLAGEKQVFRKTDTGGRFREDVIGTRDEAVAGGQPMLEKVMENGRVVGSYAPLKTVRERFLRQFDLLADEYKSIREPARYPVRISERLSRLQEGV